MIDFFLSLTYFLNSIKPKAVLNNPLIPTIILQPAYGALPRNKKTSRDNEALRETKCNKKEKDEREKKQGLSNKLQKGSLGIEASRSSRGCAICAHTRRHGIDARIRKNWKSSFSRAPRRARSPF